MVDSRDAPDGKITYPPDTGYLWLPTENFLLNHNILTMNNTYVF